MSMFARGLLDALFDYFLRHITTRPRHNRTLARAVAFAPETKAYIPTSALPDEHTANKDFPRQWLALEKRIGASCIREEAGYVLELEKTYGVQWGREAEEWLYRRRLYQDPQTHEFVS